MNNYITYSFTENEYSVITLNRPSKRNAINLQMANEFFAAIEQAEEDRGKFLVIKSSDDNVFCAGGDLNDFHSELNVEEIFPHLYKMKEVLNALVTFPVPTICLLTGDAYGGGCELATACDIRIAREDTKFGYVQSNLGILPGWGGGVLLYERVQASFAFHWLTEGAILSAPYLLKQGWIHKNIAKEQWNEKDILTPYMKNSYEQMTILKSQYNEKISFLSLAAKMNEEVRQCSVLWGSEHHKQAVQEILNK
ncbi:MAG TPA: enoyl-CoA hydratase/isomerase family protein [Bacillota bacterium]|nr:enoyl-CoA hydratase/isomerase family protein [Bacillota bacterium]